MLRSRLSLFFFAVLCLSLMNPKPVEALCYAPADSISSPSAPLEEPPVQTYEGIPLHYASDEPIEQEATPEKPLTKRKKGRSKKQALTSADTLAQVSQAEKGAEATKSDETADWIWCLLLGLGLFFLVCKVAERFNKNRCPRCKQRLAMKEVPGTRFLIDATPRIRYNGRVTGISKTYRYERRCCFCGYEDYYTRHIG